MANLDLDLRVRDRSLAIACTGASLARGLHIRRPVFDALALDFVEILEWEPLAAQLLKRGARPRRPPP